MGEVFGLADTDALQDRLAGLLEWLCAIPSPIGEEDAIWNSLQSRNAEKGAGETAFKRWNISQPDNSQAADNRCERFA